jgi:hypothetical protein
VAADLLFHDYTELLLEQLRQTQAVTFTTTQSSVASSSPTSFCRLFSEAFFTTLGQCYESFCRTFRDQPSDHFVRLYTWIEAQIVQFATEVAFHIFPCPDPSLMWMQMRRDLLDFQNQSKTITSSLRILFYGARQLELTGLPVAMRLAQMWHEPLCDHMRNYLRTIKVYNIDQ